MELLLTGKVWGVDAPLNYMYICFIGSALICVIFWVLLIRVARAESEEKEKEKLSDKDYKNTVRWADTITLKKRTQSVSDTCRDNNTFEEEMMKIQYLAEPQLHTIIREITAATMLQARGDKLALAEDIDPKDRDFLFQVQGELDSRSGRLFKMWTELESIERDLQVLDLDCRMLTEEYRMGLALAATAAGEINEEVYALEECEEASMHRYYVEAGKRLLLSENERSNLRDFREHHPKADAFSGLLLRRDEANMELNDEIASLRSYASELQNKIATA